MDTRRHRLAAIVGAVSAVRTSIRVTVARRDREPEVQKSPVRSHYVDLSHPVTHGVVTIPGFPAPVIEPLISFEESKILIAEGREFSADRIEFIGGTATYIDAPRHFDHAGDDIAAIPLHKLVEIPITLVPKPTDGRREYLPSDFEGLFLAGRAVLLETDWDDKWATADYATGSPFLGPAAAHFLKAADVALVGIDAILVDDVDDPDPRPLREAHHCLLAAGVPIVENMTNLAMLQGRRAWLTAVPAAVTGVGNFPVRAFARWV